MKRAMVGLLLVALVTTGAACQTAVAGRRCKSGIAEDKTYVLTCKNGRWVRFISKADGLRLIARLKAQKAAEDAAQSASAQAAVQAAAQATPPTTPPDFFPPGSPTQFEVIFALPSDSTMAPDLAAVRHELLVVGDWFSAQSGGRRPKFESAGGEISIRTVTLPTTLATTTADTVRRDVGAPITGTHSLIYVAAESGLCSKTDTHVSMLFITGTCLPNAPAGNSLMGSGGTFLTAKELTHALGALPGCATHSDGAGNVTDTPSDILYLGSVFPDSSNLTLDSGHDDYFLTKRTDCLDIAANPLW